MQSGHRVTPYALFGGDTYYPAGGWNDYLGQYSTKEQAVAAGSEHIKPPPTLGSAMFPSRGWYHVVDMRTFEIVAAGTIE